MKRVCVYPKDVSALTGKGIRKCPENFTGSKVSVKKEKYQFITIKEFAALVRGGINRETM